MTVLQGVSQDLRGVAPTQSLPLQIQGGEDRGRGGERIEGAEEVAGKVRVDPAVVPDRSSGLVLGLQDLHAPARVGQEVRGDQPIGTRTDHYGVRHESLPA